MAFAKGRKPDGFGTDWLGPHWVAELVGLAAFAVLIVCFLRMLLRDSDR